MIRSPTAVFSASLSLQPVDHQRRDRLPGPPGSRCGRRLHPLQAGRSQGRLQGLQGLQRQPRGRPAQPVDQEPKLNDFFNDRACASPSRRPSTANRSTSWSTPAWPHPRQYSPLKASPQYYEKLTNAYIKYDLAEANKLLDAAGYTAKDADGFRKYKDGSATITFTIEGTDNTGTPGEDSAQQIVKMWAEVGVKCSLQVCRARALPDTTPPTISKRRSGAATAPCSRWSPEAHHLPRHAARPPVGGRLRQLVQRQQRRRCVSSRRMATSSRRSGKSGRRSRLSRSCQAERTVQADPRHLGRRNADDRRAGRAALLLHRQERHEELPGWLPEWTTPPATKKSTTPKPTTWDDPAKHPVI